MKNDTIFGKIIKGEISSTKVYEDDKCLAFMDINPVSKGHLLLIPKEHYVWMQDVPNDLLSYLFIKTKELMLSMKKGFDCDYVQISVVGKDVPHFHIHLIPRMLGDNLGSFTTFSYEENEVNIFADKIKNGLK